MTGSIIATIVVAAFLIFFIVWGYRKGFLRLLITTFALLVTVTVAGVLTPYISSFLKGTFVGKGVDSRVEKSVDKVEGIELIDNIGTAQTDVINNLPLPDFIKDALEGNRKADTNVNEEGGKFSDFIKSNISNVALNIISYLIVGILIYIIIRIILGIGRFINRLPVVGGLNRLLGAIMGLAQALLILWIICLIIILISNTEFGMKVTQIIKDNAFLRLIYENNGILILVDKLFGAIT